MEKPIDSPEQKSPSLKKNYFFNVIYKIVLIVIPLITTPYVSRVLDPSSLGQASYAINISTYFVLLASVGFSYYAQRCIAEHPNDPQEQSKIYWEIMIVKFCTVLFSAAIYFVCILFSVFGTSQLLFFISLLNVIAIAFDSSFFLTGNQNFKTISLTGSLVKIVALLLIFFLVKTNNDLAIYLLILCSSSIAVYLIQIPFVVHSLKKVPFSSLRPYKHFWPSLRLFIPAVAFAVYSLVDKTLINYFVSGTTVRIIDGTETTVTNASVENGYYDQAEKIIKMLSTILTSIGGVMTVKNSSDLAEGEDTRVLKHIYKASRFSFMIGLPMVTGLASISLCLIPVFCGAEYLPSAYILMVMSSLVLLIGLNSMYEDQWLIPKRKDLLLCLCVLPGFFINVGLSIFLIRIMGAMGAGLGSVVSEVFILFLYVFTSRKSLSPKQIFLPSWKYLVSAIVMGGVVFSCYYFLFRNNTVLNLVLLILIGIVTYVICLFILRDGLFLDEIHRLWSKIFKKKVR